MTKWITCSERLPPEPKGDIAHDVLIWYQAPGGKGRIKMAYREYGHWIPSEGFRTYASDNISHWMPLPESPLTTKTEIE